MKRHAKQKNGIIEFWCRADEVDAEIERLKNDIEECRSVSAHWHTHTIQLQAENERLRQDAEQWQWLKENDQLFLIALKPPNKWDETINAAREKQK